MTLFKQQKIEESVDLQKLPYLKEDHTAVREKARIESLPLSQSSVWVVAAPIPPLGLYLHPNEFGVTVKCIFGIKNNKIERKCPDCASDSLDVFGDCSIVCQGKSDAIARHDKIFDRVETGCSTAKLS